MLYQETDSQSREVQKQCAQGTHLGMGQGALLDSFSDASACLTLCSYGARLAATQVTAYSRFDGCSRSAGHNSFAEYSSPKQRNLYQNFRVYKQEGMRYMICLCSITQGALSVLSNTWPRPTNTKTSLCTSSTDITGLTCISAYSPGMAQQACGCCHEWPHSGMLAHPSCC